MTAPIHYLYSYLHNAIRSELDSLGEAVTGLHRAAASPAQLAARLAQLQDQYRFLAQVYTYHSSVEDEVVYPALDSKVRNVTQAYSVEHEDEEQLFEQLAQLLSRALQESGKQQGATVRLLACKVEEIHTTLRKHLAKEEEQLLPLLLHHFSPREQAELVAQFLCCIPLAVAEPVLAWLKRSVPQQEQAALMVQVQAVVGDRLLQQLLISWLAPAPAAQGAATGFAGQQAQHLAPTASSSLSSSSLAGSCAAGDADFVCCRRGDECGGVGAADGTTAGPPACLFERDMEEAGAPVGSKPPLREILYFHQAIRSALQSFAEEARAVRDTAEAGVGAAQLGALVERHRFLRAVCMFHSASEDAIVFPALRRIASQTLQQGKQGQGVQEQQQEQQLPQHGAQQEQQGLQRHRCEDDHDQESAKFEELGRLLGDVKACARRGAKELDGLAAALSEVADSLAKAMSRHMAREESEVLPVLMRTLCPAEQRHMVWRILRAMPLRLLERVMPWVAGKLREEDVQEWLANIRSAAQPRDASLVELLCQWARRGRLVPQPVNEPLLAGYGSTPSRRSMDDPSLYSNQTCGPASFLSGLSASMPESMQVDSTSGAASGVGSPRVAAAAFAPQQQQLKRIRTEAPPAEGSAEAQQLLYERLHSGEHAGTSARLPLLSPRAMLGGGGMQGGYNPIDHIFQFHKALRRELKELESTAVALQAAAEDASEEEGAGSLAAQVQELEARFQFLRGIYRAHSSAEDEIVFPALESKEALHNVSHAYTLDHRQEEQLFEQLAQVLGLIKASRELAPLRSHVAQLSRMCAAVRASLETHVRAEEKELWPLFAENFSREEQERLVGTIIGRTGAEVLHSMLSWVQGSMTQEEQEAMMQSLKSASRATAFEQWLGVALGPAQPGSPPKGGSAAAAASGVAGPAAGLQEDMQATLAEVAQYLAQQGVSGGLPPAPSDPASLAADSSEFRPGWEDIFRMNQKQLEAAIRRVSKDASLEPQRKAYLIQNIMASRYIVAQQRRMQSQGSSTGVTPTAGGAAGAHMDRGMDHAAAQPQPAPAVLAPHLDQQQQQHDPALSQPPHRSHTPGSGALGCRHYRRRCKLVAPCCDTSYVCRLCHDEATDHQVDRYAVAEMVCMKCGTRQPVAASCASCAAPMARYYCSICHLFDDEPGRDIYHCPFCNFCRQGKGLGVDSFHCMACNACMSLELFNRHRCKGQNLQGTLCPVCSDSLFESKYPIKECPCGHFMHSHCFGAYTRYAYTCPVCFKSLGDMGVYWRMIDSLLASERLPLEYASRRQAVMCNDCGKTGEAPWHFVYHRCELCSSYNTRVV